eukprot:2323825-Prorocentrum_lima.AAC.1
MPLAVPVRTLPMFGALSRACSMAPLQSKSGVALGASPVSGMRLNGRCRCPCRWITMGVGRP